MKPKTDTDSQLIDGLRARRRSAYSEAMRRYGDLVWSIAGMMMRDRRDAEEVVQDTFAGAFRSIERYNPEAATFATWLGNIAYHRSVDMLRRRRISFDSLDESNAEAADDEGDDNEALEADIGLLRAALDLLAPAERTLLTLVYFRDMALSEVAGIMQSNPSALSARLYRIRNKLSRIINEHKQQQA